MLIYLHRLLGIMNRSLNFVSWNVKGFQLRSREAPVKRRKVLPHLKQLYTATAFLQETYIRSSDDSRLMSLWGEQQYHSTFQANARGVSIIINPNISFKYHNVFTDIHGHYIIVLRKLFKY